MRTPRYGAPARARPAAGPSGGSEAFTPEQTPIVGNGDEDAEPDAVNQPAMAFVDPPRAERLRDQRVEPEQQAHREHGDGDEQRWPGRRRRSPPAPSGPTIRVSTIPIDDPPELGDHDGRRERQHRTQLALSFGLGNVMVRACSLRFILVVGMRTLYGLVAALLPLLPEPAARDALAARGSRSSHRHCRRRTSAPRRNADLATARAVYNGEPSKADAMLELARAQTALGRVGDALETLTHGLEANPDEPRLAARARARITSSIRKFELAAARARKAAEKLPEAPARSALRMYLAADYARAREAFGKCADPGVFGYLGRAGGSRARLGHSDGSAAHTGDDVKLPGSVRRTRQEPPNPMAATVYGRGRNGCSPRDSDDAQGAAEADRREEPRSTGWIRPTSRPKRTTRDLKAKAEREAQDARS